MVYVYILKLGLKIQGVSSQFLISWIYGWLMIPSVTQQRLSHVLDTGTLLIMYNSMSAIKSTIICQNKTYFFKKKKEKQNKQEKNCRPLHFGLLNSHSIHSVNQHGHTLIRS